MVGKVTAEIITSEPLGNSKADRARRPALLPELVRTQCLTPKNLAASDENNLPSSASCQFLVIREFLIERIMARYSSIPVIAPPYFTILILSNFCFLVAILLYFLNFLQKIQGISSPIPLICRHLTHSGDRGRGGLCGSQLSYTSVLYPLTLLL